MNTKRSCNAAASIACAFLLLAPAAFAEVTANPSTVTFNNHDQSALVSLTHNGQPIPAGSVGKSQFLVDTSDYSHMIEVTATEGGVRVSPSPQLEVGSYNLVIGTSHGPARILVYAPLADLPSILDSADVPGGPRLRALREELGFTRPTGRATVSIELPYVVRIGEPLTVTMPHDAELEYIWAINGEVVQRGLGESTFQYAFNTPGDYVLSYAERRDGVTVARTEAITRVSEPPALLHFADRGSRLSFEAPEGYAEYHWYVNGEVTGTQRTFTPQFDTAGEYVVSVHAVTPGQSPYMMRYRTIVE